ncbi:MAG: AraC family transcriptional regulator [Lentisphaerae bacterium]|nr:AraC family transcriptional regulator [Lentisphaerota bacterium]MCP4103894.1 AraC family transcriptional regulator [Lentisphaerota bacterium]
MSQIIKQIEKYNLPEGITDSRLEGVRFFKQKHHIPRTPLQYNPGLCFVLQGDKTGYLGGKKFQYNENSYLVVPVFIQFECETFTTPEAPLLGLYVDINIPQLLELISAERQKHHGEDHQTLKLGMGAAEMEEEIFDAVFRLVKSLRSDNEAQILGPGILREIYYRALSGPQAPMLYALAANNGSFSSVARALRLLQKNYNKKLNVDQLAAEESMSTSVFFRAFKEITSESPMQYIKKLRLNKAKDLLMHDDQKIYAVADSVGYQSTSQFSREFSRHFGKSPARMVEELRVQRT